MVSIVMPSRNQARFLPAALESVLGQSHSDLELIVADGASTDGSVDLLREYAAKDSRLRWSSAPDTGPAQAVNGAARQARGEVLGWLNADDLYAPDAFAHAVHFFRAHPEDVMVYGHAQFVGAENEPLGDYPTKNAATPFAAFADGCFVCQPTVFIKRGAWENSGGLNEAMQTSFDLDLWIRLFKENPTRIGFLERVQAFSRRHEESITAKQRQQIAFEALEILKQHLDLTPAHWILTHIEEIMADHPDGSGLSLGEKIASLMAKARSLMKEQDFFELEQRVAADRRIDLAGHHSFIEVHPDGWAGPTLTARLDPRRLRGIKLTGRSGLPAKSKHRLTIRTGDRTLSSLKVRGAERFVTLLVPPNDAARPTTTMHLLSDKVFRPCETEPGSIDDRELSVIVETAQELP